MAKRGRSRGVGYGRPPRETQFRPGQSGNPKGRPRGSKNFASVMKKVLTRRIKVTQNGAQRQIPTQEAFAHLLTTRALAGDAKAMSLLLRMIDVFDSEPTAPSGRETTLSPEDHIVMADVVRRMRAMEEPPASLPDLPTPKPEKPSPSEE